MVLSCTERFEFTSQSYDQLLVVDGTLSNEFKTHQIKLSYTYPLDSLNSGENVDIDGENTSTNIYPVINAEVYVEDLENNRQYFSDEGYSGIYLSQNAFSPLVGQSYRLIINLETGESYESSFEELVPAVPIDSIYDSYVELPNDESDENEWGIQFFIDAHDASGRSKYFRYEWEETWQIRVPFSSRYTVNEEEQVVLREEEIGICYESGKSNGLTIATSVNSSDNRLQEIPVNFHFERDPQLQNKYSILVKQFTITEAAYLFYRKLKENNESKGTLADKQTGTIVGNITSITDPNEPVLGYFEVSSVSQRREFFSLGDFDERFRPGRFPYSCNRELDAQVVPVEEAPEIVGNGGLNQIWILEQESPIAPVFAVIFPKTCTSCNWYSSTQEPDFWVHQ